MRAGGGGGDLLPGTDDTSVYNVEKKIQSIRM